MIKMLLVRVGREPELIETERDFKFLHKFLDYEILEAIGIPSKCCILCNGKGRNAFGIIGDFLIAGPILNGEYSSLKEKQIQFLLHYLKKHGNEDLF